MDNSINTFSNYEPTFPRQVEQGDSVPQNEITCCSLPKIEQVGELFKKLRQNINSHIPPAANVIFAGITAFGGTVISSHPAITAVMGVTPAVIVAAVISGLGACMSTALTENRGALVEERLKTNVDDDSKVSVNVN